GTALNCSLIVVSSVMGGTKRQRKRRAGGQVPPECVSRAPSSFRLWGQHAPRSPSGILAGSCRNTGVPPVFSSHRRSACATFHRQNGLGRPRDRQTKGRGTDWGLVRGPGGWSVATDDAWARLLGRDNGVPRESVSE